MLMFVSEEGRAEFEQHLNRAGFEGPVDLGGDFLTTRYGAVCKRCGALVLLNDPVDNPVAGAEPTQIERGIYLHATWHGELNKEDR